MGLVAGVTGVGRGGILSTFCEESAECLVEVLSMLGSSSNQQSQFMSSVMQSWREESGLVHE